MSPIISESGQTIISENFDTIISQAETTTTTTTIDYSVYSGWLTISEPVYPIKERTIFPAVRTEKDAPYIQVRKKWTTPKKEWTLEWDEQCALPEIEYQVLEAFFLAKQGSSFTWTHYATGITYIVMFNQDELESNIIIPETADHPGYRTVTICLREV